MISLALRFEKPLTRTNLHHLNAHASLSLTHPSLELEEQKGNHLLVIAGHAQIPTSSTKCSGDDRHEHRHANKDHEKDEQKKGQRAECWMRIQQISGVEFQQQHFEQHLRGEKQRRARPDLRHEQHVEQTDEREHYDREHQRELKQIDSAVL